MTTMIFTSPIGLGHITRDIAIVNQIIKLYGYSDFDFITGSIAFDFISSEIDSSQDKKFNTYNIFSPPRFSINNGKLENNFLWLLRYISYYRKSKLKVENLLANKISEGKSNSLIISDEDFASLSVAKDLSMSRIFITDILYTHFIKSPVFSKIEKFLNKSMHGLIKSSNCVIIPECGNSKDNFFYVGPIVREILESREYLRKKFSFNKKTILVTTGGTTAGLYLIKKTIETFSKLKNRIDCDLIISFSPPHHHKSFSTLGNNEYRKIGFVQNIHEYIYASDLVISLAGKSTIDESLVYGTPGIFIPIKNHFEQEERASAYGFTYNDINNLESVIETNLKVNHGKKDKKVDNGAIKAANLIYEYLNK